MEKNKEIEHWVIQYLDYLLQYAIFKTQDRQVSEDLVQDTFISAHKAFDSFNRLIYLSMSNILPTKMIMMHHPF